MITWQPNNEVRETGTVEGKRADSLIPCSQESATETRDLEQVYRELSPALRAYLTWKVGNPEQAEDLVQETFYRALKALQAGTGCLPNARKAYRPWLFRIATNLAIDLLRRRRCLTWCDLEAAATVPAIGLDADPEEVYPHLEVAEAVRTTLGQLPAHYCTSLVLHYQHGLTASQVAQMIGVTPGGVQDAVAARARGLCPALPRAGGGIRMTTATSPARTTTLRGTIYTLGYAQPDAAAQLERLMRDPQVCLVDIRLQPRSRRWPQWNRAALTARYGRRYVWDRRLGNSNYRDREQGISLSEEHPDAIREAAALLCEGTSLVLLCACKNPRECHRSLVARLIQDALPIPKHGEVR